MGKRKRKSKRRKDAAIRTFGLKGDAARNEAVPLYQSSFQKSDIGWLVDEYQRRTPHEPSLTLEDFAAEYGVSAEELRSYTTDGSRDVDSSVVLWHGTTQSRAESILKEGFRRRKGERSLRYIFFAGGPGMARSIAQGRAAREDDQPALIRCSIDLSRYSDYENRGKAVYAFRHNCIASDVIEKVEGLPQRYRKRTEAWPGPEDPDNGFTNVVLTFNSGRAGIAYWLNSYLKLDGADRMYEQHETVGKIKEWLDEQMDSGRFGEVSEDEILEQLRKAGRPEE